MLIRTRAVHTSIMNKLIQPTPLHSAHFSVLTCSLLTPVNEFSSDTCAVCYTQPYTCAGKIGCSKWTHEQMCTPPRFQLLHLGVNFFFRFLTSLEANGCSLCKCFFWASPYLCRLVREQITWLHKKSPVLHVLLRLVYRSPFEDRPC